MDRLDKLGYLALGSRLKRLSDYILSQGHLIYKESDIDFDPKWFPVFHLLHEQGSLGVMEIAKELNISHPYVILLVKELVKAGLATNSVNAHDARKRSISLTSSGQKMAQRMTELWADMEHTLTTVAKETNHDLIDALRLLEAGLENKSLLNRYRSVKDQRLMEKVEIVTYSDNNAEIFKALNTEWLKKYFKVEDVDKKVLGNPKKYIMDPGGCILFAKFNDKIVGTCALKKDENGRYELTKMAVTEKAQGYKIGKKLGIAIIDEAKKLNLDYIFLETNSALTPAINLYKKLGFVEKKNPLDSDYVRADIYMELSLK